LLLLLLVILSQSDEHEHEREKEEEGFANVSPCAGHRCPISLPRTMHFGVREIAAAVSTVALIFCCSCEKHRLGEDPEVQKERVDVAGGQETSSEAIETSPSPEASASPTPVEFFPESTPH
jgi:hypothetical protein